MTKEEIESEEEAISFKEIIENIKNSKLKSFEIDLSDRALTNGQVVTLMETFDNNPEYAKEITSLNLSGNNISSIIISSSLIGLVEFAASENKIRSLIFPKELTNLEGIHVACNQLNEFKVLGAREGSLKELHIGDNNLDSEDSYTKFISSEAYYTFDNNPFSKTPDIKPKKYIGSELKFPEEMTKRHKPLLTQFNQTIENSRPQELSLKEFVKEFSDTYFSLYNDRVDIEALITPETEAQFKLDLTKKFRNLGLSDEKIEHQTKESLLNTLKSWVDPELFNLHPIQKGNRLVQSPEIKNMHSRFPNLFSRVPKIIVAKCH